mmetsp:Transcript_19575/g.27101  ORF Transcript_19575/g.27101 Transcript_19575/m.27101 type:complete len:169 (+) Transcript_19575:212-718(+)|eukprot:CAMPEP_0196578790 /NCGR_PEP_ID=MMETSP1081-20130531/7625_1 /TAXON_ID=36882 /ORGANISM="Pyramimonas amylifera, Strain CCMP720" /LENGTH=168 /DNA_ID=CAMNT_0041898117 /DNA_START=108 /DNA_END=614 /DNA_ORIENTATION=+
MTGIPPLPVKIVDEDLDLKTHQLYSSIKKAFNQWDRDDDGFCNQDEAREVLRMLGQKSTYEIMEAMLEEMDANSDGVIDLVEFLALMTKHSLKGMCSKEHMRESLNTFDPDKTGKVPLDKIRNTVMSVGDNLPSDEADDVLGFLEVDEEGNVGVEDLLSFLMLSASDD